MHLEATRMRIVRELENGAIEVDMPLFRSGTLNLARSASRTDATVTVSDPELHDIVGNFDLFGRSVPVSRPPHVPFSERGGAADAFVTAVRTVGSQIMGTVRVVDPELASEVRQGRWEGFSVEMLKDLELATGKIPGWTLVGGIFTNRPAAAVHGRIAASHYQYALAASAFEPLFERVTERPEKAAGDDSMSKDTVSLEAQLADERSKAATLSASLDQANSERNALAEKVTSLESGFDEVSSELSTERTKAQTAERERARAVADLASMRTEYDAQSDRMKRLEDEGKAASIIRAVKAAIRSGVVPSKLEGYEKNPIQWMTDKGFASLDGLQNFLDVMPRDERLRAPLDRRPDG